MTIRNQIRTIFIILIFLYSIESKGQRGTIRIKKTDTTQVTLSISNLSDGFITKNQLIKDHALRLEKNSESKYLLKKYTVSLNINGMIYDNYMTEETKLTDKQINIIRSSKKEFKNILFIENAVAIDKNGKEIKLNTIQLIIISP
jgi:hypothetical protein